MLWNELSVEILWFFRIEKKMPEFLSLDESVWLVSWTDRIADVVLLISQNTSSVVDIQHIFIVKLWGKITTQSLTNEQSLIYFKKINMQFLYNV
jgi:hypothetical protein